MFRCWNYQFLVGVHGLYADNNNCPDQSADCYDVRYLPTDSGNEDRLNSIYIHIYRLSIYLSFISFYLSILIAIMPVSILTIYLSIHPYIFTSIIFFYLCIYLFTFFYICTFLSSYLLIYAYLYISIFSIYLHINICLKLSLSNSMMTLIKFLSCTNLSIYLRIFQSISISN